MNGSFVSTEAEYRFLEGNAMPELVVVINSYGFFSNFFKVLNWCTFSSLPIFVFFTGQLDNNGITTTAHPDLSARNVWEELFEPVQTIDRSVLTRSDYLVTTGPQLESGSARCNIPGSSQGNSAVDISLSPFCSTVHQLYQK